MPCRFGYETRSFGVVKLVSCRNCTDKFGNPIKAVTLELVSHDTHLMESIYDAWEAGEQRLELGPLPGPLSGTQQVKKMEYPYTAIGAIVKNPGMGGSHTNVARAQPASASNDGGPVCTGFIIQNHPTEGTYVATAAHCVIHLEADTYVAPQYIAFAPQYNSQSRGLGVFAVDEVLVPGWYASLPRGEPLLNSTIKFAEYLKWDTAVLKLAQHIPCSTPCTMAPSAIVGPKTMVYRDRMKLAGYPNNTVIPKLIASSPCDIAWLPFVGYGVCKCSAWFGQSGGPFWTQGMMYYDTELHKWVYPGLPDGITDYRWPVLGSFTFVDGGSQTNIMTQFTTAHLKWFQLAGVKQARYYVCSVGVKKGSTTCAPFAQGV